MRTSDDRDGGGSGKRNKLAFLERFGDSLERIHQGLRDVVATAARVRRMAGGPVAAFVWLAPGSAPGDTPGLEFGLEWEMGADRGTGASRGPGAGTGGRGPIDYFILAGNEAYSPWPDRRISVPTDRAILCVPLDSMLRRGGTLRRFILERIARDLITLSALDLER